MSKLFGGVLRETRLARARGTEKERRIGGVAVGERREDLGQVGDFGITMLNLLGNEAGPKHASIGYH